MQEINLVILENVSLVKFWINFVLYECNVLFR